MTSLAGTSLAWHERIDRTLAKAREDREVTSACQVDQQRKRERLELSVTSWSLNGTRTKCNCELDNEYNVNGVLPKIREQFEHR